MFGKFSVKKPYTVLVGVVLVLVLGGVSLFKMTADLLPNMNLPYALIITTYAGAAPEEVEKDLTAPIEAAMATTSNIKTVTSNSSNSYSMVILEYEQSAKMDSIVIEIQQKLDQLQGNFPTGVGNPIIMQLDPSMLPVVVASADVEGYDQLQITEYAEDTLVPNIESIEGVASVSLVGTATEQIQITIDEDKLDKVNDKIVEQIDKKFDDARAELNDGKQKIEDGQKELDKGKKELENKISDGANQIINGKLAIYSGEATINTTKPILQTAKTTLDKISSALYEIVVSEKKLNDQIAALDEILAMTDEDIMSSKGNTRAEIEAQRAQLVAQRDDLVNQRKKLLEEIKQLDELLKSQGTSLEKIGIKIESLDDIPDAMTYITNTQGKLNAAINQMDSAQGQINDGKAQLDSAYVELLKGQMEAIFQMADASAQLTIAKAGVEQGEEQLDTAYDQAIDQADVNKILTVDMVSNLITAQNFSMPAGYIQEGKTSYLVKVGDEVSSVEDLEALVLLDMNMEGINPIHLCDIATVEVTNNAEENYARINGNPAVMMTIEKQTGYATGEIADRVLERFELLEKTEEGLNIAVLMNQGIYIDMIVKSVLTNMLTGAVLSIIILIIFLKDFRSTFVIACSIPLSVVFAIVLMYFTGITLNIISLSGLALGIGMLVDNSIVVIENIYRLRKEGLPIKKASVIGSNQVAGAIIASTITTICVFAPIIFTEGITKQIFVDLALTVTYTLCASLVVALTFVPMMSSVFLKNSNEKKTVLFDKIRDFYGDKMYYVLKFKPLVLVLVLVLFVVSIFAGFSRGFSFMDMEMESDQISLTVGPKEEQYLSEEDLRARCDELSEILVDIDGLETVGIMIGGDTMSLMGGSSTATVYLLLDEDTDRKSSEIAEEIEEKTADIDCAIQTSLSSMDFSQYFGNGLSIEIKGRDLDKLAQCANDVAAIVEGVEGTVDVDPGLGETTTSLVVHVDKEKAMEYQMTVAQVFQLVYAKMADTTSKATISTDIKDYDVFIKNEEQAEVTLDDIKNLRFTHVNADGDEEEVKLSRIATFEEGTSIDTINRSGQSRYLTVTAGVDEEHNITQVSSKVKKALENYELPEGYSIEMAGEDETIMEAMGQLGLMLVLAVVFIYLVMVAQFQSLLSPFIIMFTIPLAFTGGLLSLFFTGNDVSIIGAVGFVMLAGVIVNNGIVMVDYINQLRQDGLTKRDAICESCKSRLRPILMTAFTTIISMIPMALGMGDGAELMQPMAIVMIGGMVYGTLLTLFVVPCIYDIFNKNKDMRVDEFGERIADGEQAVTD